MLPSGLYEQIINKALDAELAETDKLSETARIDEAEAAKVLAKYVAEIVEKGLDNVKDNGGDLHKQVELVNRIVSTIVKETQESEFAELSVAERAEQLLALLEQKNTIRALDLSDLHQLFQRLRPLLQVQFLLSSLLVDGRHQAQDLRIPFLLPVFVVIERSHALTSFFIPLYLSYF